MTNNESKTIVIDPLKEAHINAYKPRVRLGNDNPSESFRSALKHSREFRNNKWGC